MKHLLTMQDLSKDEIMEILDLADQLKYERKHGISHRYLEGKSVGLIFQKSSTRTRVSFETGVYQLGGQALFLFCDCKVAILFLYGHHKRYKFSCV